MKCVISRVDRASVRVDGKVIGEINHGLLAYVGIVTGDQEAQVNWTADKLCAIRLFNDEDGKLNRSVVDVDGGLLLIPNFTVPGRTRKGTRPSFTDSAPPELATRLFDRLTEKCGQNVTTQTGLFGAHMLIEAVANGPVTVIVESPES